MALRSVAWRFALPMVLCLPCLVRGDESPKPAAKTAAEKAKDDEYYEQFKIFADTLDQVERNYVKDVSRRELMEAAIKGVLSKLDQHSNYISPEDLDRFKTSVESQFGGIGIQVTIENGQLKVLSPLVGSPAYESGVLSGDRIVEIEGKTTDGIDIDEAVHRLKGDAGSPVTVKIVHAGGNKPETLTITREIIQVETVMGDRRRDDDAWDFMLDREHKIGYIRVTAFSRDTARDVEKALDELKAEKMAGLILDLRFNPGGLLTSAIEISDLFVASGRIVSTEGRNSPARSWDARKPGTFEGFPMVVLVNRYSASASEIVSACLQDHNRAVVMGERSYGKGSVQNVIELEGGKSALKLTTAGYLRPSGKNIDRASAPKDSNEWGVSPNSGFEMKLGDGEMLALVTGRRNKDIQQVHGKKETKPGESALPEKIAPKEETKPAEGDKPAEKPVEGSKPEGRGEYKDRQLARAVEHLLKETGQEAP